uniref:Calmodulin n=1 Tax=Globisporangium ultimum (strain ATCC 200006 / CBS 805.95 / DAOM BR144) TaxID=431595 RepID=K3X581_GLOUD
METTGPAGGADPRSNSVGTRSSSGDGADGASRADGAAAFPEVRVLADGGTLSVDGFVYIDGEKRKKQDPTDNAAVVDVPELDERQKQLVYAIHSLQMYNPNFNLTPEVLEIMRVFFEDLHPDKDGTITLRALFDEIARLDPEKQLVTEETRQLMWRDISGNSRDEGERIDFHGFCEWVMRWKEISPAAVQNVYTSWAQQIAIADFGLSEGDGVFVVRPEELPPREVLRAEISKLLRSRERIKPRASRSPPSRTFSKGGDNSSSGSERISSSEDHQTHGLGTASTTDSMDRIADEEINESISAAELESADSTTSTEAHGSTSMSKSFVAGGAAGIVAKSVLAPVERVKIMFQVNDKRHFSFRNAFNLAREIYVQDGFRALFRGNMLNILRVIPYAGVQHSSFDFFRRKFHAYNFAQAEKSGSPQQYQKLSNLQLVTAGSLAGGMSLIMAYPLDIVRARYMVQQGKHQYNTLYEAVMSMYKREGARSFSRGLVPSLLGTLPYTGIGFALNEKFKHWV